MQTGFRYHCYRTSDQKVAEAGVRANFEQVVHVCRMAEPHETIDQLPQGYQIEPGKRGVNLSGGQKQRLAIARALLKQPKILIFDDTTSSLDGATAEYFAVTINQLKGKVTMIFITHAKPKTLLVEEVVRISEGEVVALRGAEGMA
jgi:subfamily B ATP-binding cassette protein HlyB/CyaB